MTQGLQYCLWLAETVFIGSALSLLASPTLAQIVPDTSLGAESSRLTPSSTVRGQAADRIDGGALRGENLFHSFSDFNVNAGQRVYFSNPVGVHNILSRVTGTTRSNISGTLGVDGGANLFLLNPNGIIFGPNARLDISGSFVGSTADRFAFPAGGEFSATNPQAPPLLTVSLPLGLQYGRGDITNRGSLTAGQDLALFGNTLDLQGQLRAGRDLTLQAQGIVQTRDSQTAPFVASAGRNLSLEGNQGIDILALSHPQSQIGSGGNLSLIGDGTISGDAHFASGGNFSIRSASGGLANFVSLYDPIISAVGNVDLAANYSGASLLIESQGNVRVQGTVDVTAPDTVSNFVGADAVLGTQAGLIVRSGQTSLVYGGTNQNSPPAFTGGVIPEGVTLVGAVTTAGGPVRVDAATGNVNTSSISTQGGELRLNAVGGDITAMGILSTINGALDGGNITLNAARNIITTDLNSSSSSSSSSFSDFGDSGKGGAIAISAGSDISTRDIYSFSISDSGNSGNGGAIAISAGRDISTGDIGSDSFSFTGSSRNGGAIAISAGSDIATRDIRSISNFFSSSGNSGNGGSIALSAGSNISTRNIRSTSSSENPGNGGAIALSAGSNISTRDISSTSFSVSGNSGNGGAIAISAGSNISTRDIRSTSSSENPGNGGAIALSAGSNISTRDIDSSSTSFTVSGNSGNGGAIALSAGSNISTRNIKSTSFSFSFTGSSRNGGAIAISAGRDIATDDINSFSYSDSGNSGNGGAIALSAAGNLTTGDLGSFSYSTTGNSGNGGAIALSAAGNLTTGDLGSSSYSATFGGSSGNGGAIAISAGSDISIRDIDSSSYSFSGNSGNGGEILLSAEGDIMGRSDRAAFNSFSVAERGTSGQGGNVTLNAQSTVRNLEILTLSSSSDAGAVQLDGAGDFSVTNTRILTSQQVRIRNPIFSDQFITLRVGDRGRSGNIRVTSSGNLTFNNSSIQSDTKGSDPAGDVTITSGGQLTFNDSEIIGNTSGAGRAGNITIQPNQLFLMQNSLISTAASSSEGGGNITIRINTPDTSDGFILGSNNSDIIATAVSGAGGQIDIQADGVFGFIEQAEPNLEVLRANDTNDISASSASGPQGVVNLSARLDPTQGIVELPTDLVDASNLVAQGCAAGGVTTASDLSEFVVTGRGGLSSSPTERLSDNTAVPNWMTLDSEVAPAVSAAASTLPQPIDAPIVEAQGWSIGSNGDVVLIANAPTATLQPPAPAQASCSAVRN